MKLIKSNNYPYFKDFDYYNMFSEDLNQKINKKIDIYKNKGIRTDFTVKDSYISFPVLMLRHDTMQFSWFEGMNPELQKEFISIIKQIENDLNIIVTFCIFIKSHNKAILAHNHIGYNYKQDRHTHTLKYILEFTGDKSAYFFCENNYVKFNKQDINKSYIFKTFRSHMYFSNDKSNQNNYRYELAFNFLKRDFYEKNKDQYHSIFKQIHFPKTNFNMHYHSSDICIRLSPSYFIFKKNKNRIIL